MHIEAASLSVRMQHIAVHTAAMFNMVWSCTRTHVVGLEHRNILMYVEMQMNENISLLPIIFYKLV